ncbi:MAG: M48 family metalloprotease [Treponema sp.]|nr:M48 family metalloprotease [Treponema sp.]
MNAIKTKKYIMLILFILLISSSLIISCTHAAAVASVGAQVAGAFGVIDQNLADAISLSADSIGRAAEEITPEQEYFIGRAVAANLLVSYNVWNGNPALTSYLNSICRAIAINSPRPDIFSGYFVNILDTYEINAFATPGGHIFITRGLLSAANSEDALAGIIAHEIAHIQLQHGIKSIRNNRIMQALVVTGISAGGVAAGYDVNELTDIFNESVSEIVTTLVNSGYSRTQEFEADDLAVSLMAHAGYNPSALITMLRVLEGGGQDTSRGFGRTHPTPAQRISNAGTTVNLYPVQDTSTFRIARFNEAIRQGI